MTENQVFDIIVEHAREVLPDLEEKQITPRDSLRRMGANSIDRSEILMMTLESLSVNMPLVDLAKAEDIGELATLIHARLQ